MNWLKKILKFLGFQEDERKKQPDIEITSTAKPLIQEPVNNEFAKDVSLEAETGQVFVDEELRYITPTTFPVILKSNKQTNCTYLNGINRNDKGVMEDYFFDYASGKLQGKLKNDIQIKLPDITITPDFIYADEEKKIFIAIEIDEPYSINNNHEFIPIHYKGSDDNRNKGLLAIGWSIIRFAEEQIARNPSECAKFIEQYINGKDINEIEAIVCWSKEEAEKMIERKFRNTYLPYEFQEASLSNSKSSYRSLDFISISFRQSKKDEKFAVISLGHKIDANSWVNGCQCWVNEDCFWKKFEETSVSQIIKTRSRGYDYELVNFIEPQKFEGYGKLNGDYFNLNKGDEFKLIYTSIMLKILNMQPRFQSKKEFEQVSLELLYPIYHFEEKVKKLKAAGVKEFNEAELSHNYKQEVAVLRKYGIDLKL